MTFIVIHVNNDALSQRYQKIGTYSFKTNYIRSAFCLDHALRMVIDDRSEYPRRYEQVIEELKPWANTGWDDNYSFILMTYAKYLRVIKRDYEKALQYHIKSRGFYVDNPVNNLGLVEAYFLNQAASEMHCG